MNIGKTSNSIIVLATLGIYFGIMLPGVPKALGQDTVSPQSREMHVKGQNSFLDDLPPENYSVSVQIYLEDLESFLNTIRVPQKGRKFDWAADLFQVAQSTDLPCVDSNQVGSYTAEKFSTTNQSIRPILERFSKRLTDGYSLQDCLPNAKFSGVEATSSRFEFKFDGKEFSVEVAVRKSSPERAIQLADLLAGTFKTFRDKAPESERAKIIDSTSTKAVQNQVIVVTRLPRAGLVSLFAKDSK